MQTSAEVLLPYLIGPYSGLVILCVVTVVLYRMNREERGRTDRAIGQNTQVVDILRDIVARMERQDKEEQIRREYEGRQQGFPEGVP